VNLAVQNAFSRQYLGVATASSQFFRQIGGTIGVAVFGTLVVTGLASNIDRNLPPEVLDVAPPALESRLHDSEVLLREQGRNSLEPDFLALDDGARLFDVTLTAIRTSLADAVTNVFFVAFLVAIGAFALAVLMPERVHTPESASAAGPSPPSPQPAPAAVPATSSVSGLVAEPDRPPPRFGRLALAGGGLVIALLAIRLFNNGHNRLE
jgi:hypothetical protein